EGAELLGYRAITICGTRDPVLIEQFDDYLDTIRDSTATKAQAFGVSPEQYHLTFRVYGRDGVMGGREVVHQTGSHELGIITEVIAADQETANAVLAIARPTILHTDFPGRLCKEGNMAFPFSPSDIECGPAYRFSVFHVVEPTDPMEMFDIEYSTV
ncbi:MAG: hypothetical protein MJE12_02675, partial [Alphaproteobacteria bacterium]|nr:hypothetical protein [Alphaproteobacteria bacterium]